MGIVGFVCPEGRVNSAADGLRFNRMAIRDVSVVLAHGAWADGSSWARVITALKGDGSTVLAAPLPLTSLSDDVAALNRSLERSAGPIVLVGHAYAGAVIAEASSKRIKALVYVTALAPDAGENVADVFYRLEPYSQAPKLAPDNDGFIWLPETTIETAFAQHASAHDRAILAAVQRPISVACITVPVGRPLWKDVPSWFLVAGDDRMIAPDTQLYMAERMKAKIKVHAVDHIPSVTAPSVVVDIIRDAIRVVSLG
jgi:pimeloyl-ACP methyl ester carboxylesterase